MEKSNTLIHAEVEMDLLVISAEPDNRPIIEPFIPEILSLVDKFGHSGQSGGSAPFTAAAISQAVESLCLQKSIMPIMGSDDEWVKVREESDDDEMEFQNKRCSALFKGKIGSWYLGAIVWKTQDGATWGGPAWLANGEKIACRQYIKQFPFKPKTFVIDVIEKEVIKDDFEFYVKDESQLDEVFEYYAKRSNKLS